ncbi:class I SAM-dependent methyltransferase [Metabacillus halosaccharovorans]|uniref:class I SAM-dependent methyltransferase n=1 Tax=Metabacillus halosaccharovorans TaxID=930124 RepID=UPI00373630E7
MIGAVKQVVKEYRSSNNPIIKFSIASLSLCWNSVKNIKRFFVDNEFRSILLLQIFQSKNVHQTTPLTYMDRYPIIFSACKDYFGGKKDIKILSFGCSTGEEVLTLRSYFPDTYIVGADINKRSIAKCRKLPADNKITFIHSSYSDIQKHGPFDAVFCMAVLQRKPHYIAAKGISSIKKIYPFEKFEKQVIELDGLLKEQGILTVHFTQYSLMDTSVAYKYEAMGNYNQGDYRSPVFDKNSQLVNNPLPQKSIFIKSKR